MTKCLGRLKQVCCTWIMYVFLVAGLGNTASCSPGLILKASHIQYTLLLYNTTAEDWISLRITQTHPHTHNPYTHNKAEPLKFSTKKKFKIFRSEYLKDNNIISIKLDKLIRLDYLFSYQQCSRHFHYFNLQYYLAYKTMKKKSLYSGITFSPPTRKRSTAARLMQSFSHRPSRTSRMDTPGLMGTEQQDPSGRLMLQ